MANYNFLGLSAHIDLNDTTANRLSVIRQLIPVLYNIDAVHIPIDRDDVEDLLNDWKSTDESPLPEDVIEIVENIKDHVMRDDIDYYNEQEGLFYAEDGCFPGQTPVEYTRSQVTAENDDLYIYIPLTGKRKEQLRDTARYIIKSLRLVFGDDIAQIAVLESDEYQVFDKSQAKIIQKND